MELETTTVVESVCSLLPEVLPLMLGHLDCKQRLAAAALVSHTWHAAAVAATASMTTSLDPRDTGRHSSISSWLGKHGGQLTSLSIVGLPTSRAGAYSEHEWFDIEPAPEVNMQLPVLHLGQLRSLSLKSIRLLCTDGSDAGSTTAQAHTQAAAGATTPASSQQQDVVQQAEAPQQQQQCRAGPTAHGNASSSSSPPFPNAFPRMSGLTSLQLDNVVLVGFQGGLSSLSVLTGLQRLQLARNTTAVPADVAAAAARAAVHDGAEDGSGDEYEDEGWEESSNWSGSGEESDADENERSTELVAALSQMRQLTHLSFSQIFWLQDAALASLNSLQHLKEFKMRDYREPPRCDLGMPASFAVLPPSLTLLEVWVAHRFRFRFPPSWSPSLLPYTQLQHLVVSGAVAPFSCLQQLQQLRVLHSGGVDASNLQSLPATLTLLEFDWAFYGAARSRQPPLSSSSAPGLCQLTGLQHLVVACGKTQLNPNILVHLQQLRHLKLLGRDSEGAALCEDSLPELLELLPGLQQLEHLDLSCNASVRPLPPSDWQHYSTLVSSSNLTCLNLQTTGNMVPAGAVQHLFGRQLPILKQFKLGAGSSGRLLGPGDVCRLVSCCPALQALCLLGAVQAGVVLTSLVKLTGLTELAIRGDTMDDAFAADVLAALTQLQSLTVYHDFPGRSISHAGLVPLTQLTGLRKLSVSSSMRGGFEYEMSSHSRTPKGFPPDVWQQLQEWCRTNA